jgi:hypothetical protein
MPMSKEALAKLSRVYRYLNDRWLESNVCSYDSLAAIYALREIRDHIGLMILIYGVE